MLAGVVIGTGLVIAAGAAAEFFSFGLATPLVVAAVGATVAVAETAVIAGTGLATGAAISDSAADRGRKHREDDGFILTGVPTIFVGGKDLMAASCGSKATCNRHKHSPPASVEIVAQGSASVLLGPGRDPAARVNDQVTCQALIGTGCTTVIIGGATATCYKIDAQGDDPDQEEFDKLGKYGGYAALIGGAVLAIPAAAGGGGIMAGLRAGAWVLGKGLAIMGGTSYALNHWVHDEQTRHDIASALAIFMPFADHAAGAAKGAFRGGSGGRGSSSGGGDTGGGGSTGGGDTPTGGGGETPPTAANDNNPGGGKPPEPANDNNAGGDKPPTPANDNNASGSPTAPGETVQQIGPHDGGAPGVAPPDGTLGGGRPPAPANDNTPGGGGKPPTAANDNTPGGDEPPTPANDNTPGKAGETGDAAETGDTGKGGETTEQTGSSDGGAPGKAPPEQAEDGGGAEEGSKESAAGEADPTVQTKDSPGGEENGEGEKTATDSQSKQGQKYPKPTAETNAAAKLVRDTMNGDPRFQGLHPAVGVFGYADGAFDVGISGRAKAVSESADILQDQLPDNFRVLKVQPNRADFPGFRDVGTNMNKQGALSCAEPKLVQGAKEYQSGDGSGREVQGMSVIWRGMEPDGTPLPNNHSMPLDERGPGGEDLDLMKPCTRCQANEPGYMDGVQVSPPSSGP